MKMGDSVELPLVCRGFTKQLAAIGYRDCYGHVDFKTCSKQPTWDFLQRKWGSNLKWDSTLENGIGHVSIMLNGGFLK